VLTAAVPGPCESARGNGEANDGPAMKAIVNSSSVVTAANSADTTYCPA